MTSRKSAADDEGYKRGALGKFDPPNKLSRKDVWRNPDVLSDGLSDGKGAYTDNKLVLNRKGAMTPENETNDAARDIYNEVWDQNPDDSNRAIKSRGGQT